MIVVLVKTITIEENVTCMHEGMFFFLCFSLSLSSHCFSCYDVAELLLCQEMFCAVSQSEY